MGSFSPVHQGTISWEEKATSQFSPSPTSHFSQVPLQMMISTTIRMQKNRRISRMMVMSNFPNQTAHLPPSSIVASVVRCGERLSRTPMWLFSILWMMLLELTIHCSNIFRSVEISCRNSREVHDFQVMVLEIEISTLWSLLLCYPPKYFWIARGMLKISRLGASTFFLPVLIFNWVPSVTRSYMFMFYVWRWFDLRHPFQLQRTCRHIDYMVWKTPLDDFYSTQ